MDSISHFINNLTILFIGLKLTGCINWNWIVILLPVIIWFSFKVMAYLGGNEQEVKNQPNIEQ